MSANIALRMDARALVGWVKRSVPVKSRALILMGTVALAHPCAPRHLDYPVHHHFVPLLILQFIASCLDIPALFKFLIHIQKPPALI